MRVMRRDMPTWIDDGGAYRIADRFLLLILGVFLLAGGIAAFIALASWSVDDPSLSLSSGKPIRNLLGYPGSVFSDLAFQLYGLAAILLPMPFVIWGWRMFSRGKRAIGRWQVIFWLMMGILAACAVNIIPATQNWPLPSGFGGYLGNRFEAFVAFIMPQSIETVVTFILQAGCFIFAFIAFVRSCRLPQARKAESKAFDQTFNGPVYGEGDDAYYHTSANEAYDEEPEYGRSSAVLGMMTHWWLTTKSSISRGMGRFVAPDENRYEETPPWQDHAHAPEPYLDEGYHQPFAQRQEPQFGEPSFSGQHRPVAPHYPEHQQPLYAQPAPQPIYDGAQAPHMQPQPHPQMHPQAHAPHMTAQSPMQYAPVAPAPAHQPVAQPMPQAVPVEQYAPQSYDGYESQDPSLFATPPAAAPHPGFAPDPANAPLPTPIGIAGPGNPPQPVQQAQQQPAQQQTMGVRVQPQANRPRESRRVIRESQPTFFQPEQFMLPEINLLQLPPQQSKGNGLNEEALAQNAAILESILQDFGVRGEIMNVRPGPVVTLYELEPAPGIKSSRVIGLSDDIARSMSAVSARVAVIPGKNAIGIELPNQTRETVYFRELIASQDFDKSKAKLALSLGNTIGGEPVIADLARMPHLLVAGTTGSGKSVAINTMILSLLYRMTPEQCRLIMVDPKMLELSIYDGIPHLLAPVVTDPHKAVVAMKWTVREMEDRYRKMSKLGVRNIDGFNARVSEANRRGERLMRSVQTGFDRETGEAIFEEEELDLTPLPYIVVIVDEMADLMMVAGKDIEGAIQRLAQMARAAGIHLIMATQRPSVDVITGTIKANFPTRISFQVTSKIDSRTILGEQGAEQLLGMGDMLYMAGGGRIQRVHGPFVSDEEVESVVQHLKAQGVPDYLDQVTQDSEEEMEAEAASGAAAGGPIDENADLYDQAVAIVLRDRKASTSYVQRRLSVGYNRAASLIERMEKEGVISPANHAGKREILVPENEADMV